MLIDKNLIVGALHFEIKHRPQRTLTNYILGSMDSPILTPVSWAKGKYDSYSLHPNGKLVGMINPPGLAYCVNKDPRLTVEDNNLFLSS